MEELIVREPAPDLVQAPRNERFVTEISVGFVIESVDTALKLSVPVPFIRTEAAPLTVNPPREAPPKVIVVGLSIVAVEVPLKYATSAGPKVIADVADVPALPVVQYGVDVVQMPDPPLPGVELFTSQ